MGINGKILMVCMIESLLCVYDLCIGLFMSLYFECFIECIMIDGEFIVDDVVVDVWDEIELFVGFVDVELEVVGEVLLMFFELLIVFVFVVVVDVFVDVFVFEVGMGGEWDLMNIVDGDVVVFVLIDIDYVDCLGGIIVEIV